MNRLIQEVLRLDDDGLAPSQIAQEVGRSKGNVYRLLMRGGRRKEAGVDARAKARREAILSLSKDSIPRNAIAKHVGVSADFIRKVCREEGAGNTEKEERIAFIRKAAAEGATVAQVAAALECTTTNVRHYAARHGISFQGPRKNRV